LLPIYVASTSGEEQRLIDLVYQPLVYLVLTNVVLLTVAALTKAHLRRAGADLLVISFMIALVNLTQLTLGRLYIVNIPDLSPQISASILWPAVEVVSHFTACGGLRHRLAHQGARVGLDSL